MRILESFPIGKLCPQELYKFITEAYSTFQNEKILPLKKLDDKVFLMEEFYGPTASFKDLSLQLFPKLYQYSVKNDSAKNVILVATSGDTGSAVLSGFEKTKIPVIVLYP